MRRNIKYKSRDMNSKWRGSENNVMRGATKLMRKALRSKLKAQMQVFDATGNEEALFSLKYGIGHTDPWNWD